MTPEQLVYLIANEPFELSYDKIETTYHWYKKMAKKCLLDNDLIIEYIPPEISDNFQEKTKMAYSLDDVSNKIVVMKEKLNKLDPFRLVTKDGLEELTQLENYINNFYYRYGIFDTTIYTL